MTPRTRSTARSAPRAILFETIPLFIGWDTTVDEALFVRWCVDRFTVGVQFNDTCELFATFPLTAVATATAVSTQRILITAAGTLVFATLTATVAVITILARETGFVLSFLAARTHANTFIHFGFVVGILKVEAAAFQLPNTLFRLFGGIRLNINCRT
jgi:hypothetical protein